MTEKIILKGLRQNNLKNIYLEIPKGKIVVFTGVSGSGKSSIVFDTIAAESKRQMNDTYPAFVRSRLPKYPKPEVDSIENLSPSVIIDQAPLGLNARSTVGTVSEIYSGLRLLFSRIGQPYAGSASSFSFNDPSGMCMNCSGLGQVTDINLDLVIDWNKSLNEGALLDTTFRIGSWYWKQIVKSGCFDADKPLKEYSKNEMDLLLYGYEGKSIDNDASVRESGYFYNPKSRDVSAFEDTKDGASEHKNALEYNNKKEKGKLVGVYNIYKKRYLTRDASNIAHEKANRVISQHLCPSCKGKRLNRIALSCWINGNNIADLCDMELTDLREELLRISEPSVKDLVEKLVKSLDRMIDIGLAYLSLSRDTDSLSGGEAQRVKLVRYLGSSLSDMLYIFDEPSTGMHPRDVYRMNNLLMELRDKGNTVLVVEHDEDVISIADEVIDVGPLAGKNGGEIVFKGSYESLLLADTLTGKFLCNRRKVEKPVRIPKDYLNVSNATLHNLKNCSVDVPLNCICTFTGVAGSGKSSLIQVFSEKYSDRVIKIDQKPITATNRSTPASYLGFLDEIRKEFARSNNCDEGLFSFNSTGACPRCKGKGVLVTELAFMDPIVTTCEDCNGSRFNDEALSYTYKGKNIIEVLELTVNEACEFFDNQKILKKLKAMKEVGLSYLTLGQPLSTLSGGERQRIKLALSLSKKGSIYVLDEPTTGLHLSDIDKLMDLFNRLVKKGNSVILIEHNLEVMKMSDYIIDIGPDGGKNGGEVVFTGTPKEMIENSNTITAKCLRKSSSGEKFTTEELILLTMVSTSGKTQCQEQALDKDYLEGQESVSKGNNKSNRIPNFIIESYKTDIKTVNDKLVKSERENFDMGGYKLNPIGRIESNLGEFKVVLDKKLKEALVGLEGFSHVQIVWWFDGCDDEKSRNNLFEEKPYKNGPERIGTFATRSPKRPNPIALSTAEVISVDIENATINLEYIDAITGTPVLDIKPYTPSADRVEDVTVPQWCGHWPKSYEESENFDWEAEFKQA